MLPRVAIVGRPNVGKSSLLNRVVGRRVSIVEPTAGVTRDRVAAVAEFGGRRAEFVDTGGLGLVDEALLKAHVEAQIEVALASADLVLFVVDGKEGLVPGDQMVADRLRRLPAPHLLVVNKVESAADELAVHEWGRLGFGEPLPVSAQEGFGITDLLARVAELLPAPAQAPASDRRVPRKSQPRMAYSRLLAPHCWPRRTSRKSEAADEDPLPLATERCEGASHGTLAAFQKSQRSGASLRAASHGSAAHHVRRRGWVFTEIVHTR